MKKIFIGLLTLVIFLGTSFLLFGIKQQDSSDVFEEENSKDSNFPLVVPKQLITNSISIDTVTLKKPGYIVVRGVSKGKLAQIEEVTELLPVGTTNNLKIELLTIPPDTVTLIAVLYQDDGDGGFNPSLDTRVEYNNRVVAVDVETGQIADSTLFDPFKTIGTVKQPDVTIMYTQDGYTPAMITIEKGQTVSFVNNNNIPMWTASDPHPAHTILPSFDQFSGSDPGTTYQYTFDEVGTWNYHDHINPAFVGTIVVTEPKDNLLSALDKNKAGYYETDADTFVELADNPEVTMVNVHVPFAGEIPGTELSIPYNQTEQLLAALPKDKNAPIALYCRSGGMSAVASKNLVAAGYINVYDLTGGMNAYEQSGRELIR